MASYLTARSEIPLERERAREPGRSGSFCLPVADVISAGVVDFDDDKHMLEMGSDVFGSEGKGPGLLEYYGDDIVADVPFPQ